MSKMACHAKPRDSGAECGGRIAHKLEPIIDIFISDDTAASEAQELVVFCRSICIPLSSVGIESNKMGVSPIPCTSYNRLNILGR
jgi:hypothetical protein